MVESPIMNQLPRGKKEKLEYFRGLIDVNKPEITLSKCDEGNYSISALVQQHQ